MNQDIKEAVRAYIIKKANLEKLADEEEIIEMNYLDSMGFVVFAAWLEQKFNITVAESDLTEDNFRDIRAIETFIKTKKGA